jgi:hypothetical protein
MQHDARLAVAGAQTEAETPPRMATRTRYFIRSMHRMACQALERRTRQSNEPNARDGDERQSGKRVSSHPRGAVTMLSSRPIISRGADLTSTFTFTPPGHR